MNRFEENTSKLIENIENENNEEAQKNSDDDNQNENNSEIENELMNDKDDFNENEQLIIKENEDEKNRLIEIFSELKENLEKKDNKSIYNAYYKYLSYNEEKENMKINNRRSRCLIIFMFYIISPVISIIYLIGVFQVIVILKSLNDVLKESFKCFLLSDKCKPDKYGNNNPFDFYNYVFKNLKMKQLILI